MVIITQLLLSLGCGLFLIILGILLLKFPPKDINHIYGYRTSRSMKNKATWDSANHYSSKWLIRFGVLTLLISGSVYVLFPNHTALFSISIMTLLLVGVIPLTETHLKRHYDEDGSPKSVVEDFEKPPVASTTTKEEE